MPISRFLVLVAVLLPLFGVASEMNQQAPLLPSAGVAATEAIPSNEPRSDTPPLPLDPRAKYPARVKAPAIGLDAPIEYVGINEKGEMDVPNGKTKNVGWYQYGTVPGEMGSAVLAAHVYAAFEKLHALPAGSEIFVTLRDGTTLRFVVEEKKIYALQDLSPEELFMRGGGEWLNLITCAGTYRRSLGTYDHRLVVYAKYTGTL
jgi:sortase (surface protein transpeptidase)